jgi:antitoxin ParD1/3/4
MNISLTPELEQYVNDKVKSGLYHSASEVIRDGLRLLREQDEVHKLRLKILREEIAIGLEQADRGELLDGAEVFEKLRAKLRKNAARDKSKKNSGPSR